MRMELVSIEGNIGSGKSTLLAELKRMFAGREDVVFLKEPVDEWETMQDEAGQSILAKFYGNQEKYAFPFQIMAYISRLKVLREATQQRQHKEGRVLFITERSLFTDKMVFAKMLYDTGCIEHVNHLIYLKWFDLFAQDYPVTKVIHVDTEPDVCHARIHRRCREGEQGIPLEYLQQCDQYHRAMLDRQNPECVCATQLVLDGNRDITAADGQSVMAGWLEQINDFLSETHGNH